MLDKFGQTGPLSGIHVRVMTICDELLVDLVRSNPSCAETSAEQLYELLLEGSTEVIDRLLGATGCRDGIHLSEVRLGVEMTTISILVSTGLLTNLAVETQFGQSLRLYGVGDRFERSGFRFSHLRGSIAVICRSEVLVVGVAS